MNFAAFRTDLAHGANGAAPAFGFHLAMVDARPALNELANYSGLLVALAALLEWEALLPDAADRAVLMPLPVPRRRIVAAHGAALGALLGALTVVVNAASLILIPMLDATHEAFFLGMARQAAAVLITASLGFCAVLALRAMAAFCASLPGLRRMGEVVQLAALIAVIALLLILPALAEFGPAWHVGFRSPLPLAGWAAGFALFAAGLYLLAARHAFRPEARPRPRHHLPVGMPGDAVTHFAAVTLRRCSRPRLIVGAWFALGAGVVLASGLSVAAGRLPPTRAALAQVALAVPLVLTLFVLSGLRNSFAVPVELRANWIFQVCADGHARSLHAAARRLLHAYLAALLLPSAAFAFWCWPPAAAVAQTRLPGAGRRVVDRSAYLEPAQAPFHLLLPARRRQPHLRLALLCVGLLPAGLWPRRHRAVAAPGPGAFHHRRRRHAGRAALARPPAPRRSRPRPPICRRPRPHCPDASHPLDWAKTDSGYAQEAGRLANPTVLAPW
ncbi:MAG TPA: hypothetical protein VIE13_14255 [Terriglobales bacterium]